MHSNVQSFFFTILQLLLIRFSASNLICIFLVTINFTNSIFSKDNLLPIIFCKMLQTIENTLHNTEKKYPLLLKKSPNVFFSCKVVLCNSTLFWNKDAYLCHVLVEHVDGPLGVIVTLIQSQADLLLGTPGHLHDLPHFVNDCRIILLGTGVVTAAVVMLFVAQAFACNKSA